MHALLLATPLLLSCHLTESLDTGVDVVYPEQTGEARNTGVTTHWGALDRTIDLSDYGVDLDKVFNRLLGPSGIVNQIALTAVTQSFVILAYIIGGRVPTIIIGMKIKCSDYCVFSYRLQSA